MCLSKPDRLKDRHKFWITSLNPQTLMGVNKQNLITISLAVGKWKPGHIMSAVRSDFFNKKVFWVLIAKQKPK